MKTYLTFQIEQETFAINVEYVIHILEMAPLTKLPLMPPYMKGILDWRGIALPVMDFKIKLNLKPVKITSDTCIIVVELKGKKWGLMVEKIREVIKIKEEEIKPFPNLGNNDFIEGSYLQNSEFLDDENFVMLCDLEKVFADHQILTLT
jgi:purine-binding chemotaxis protein CheW